MTDMDILLSDLNDISEILNSNGYGGWCETIRKAVALLKEQDAVIRCKDCKNADYGTDEDGNRFMKCIGSVKCYGGTTPDFFCADGVAKDINVPGKEGR